MLRNHCKMCLSFMTVRIGFITTILVTKSLLCSSHGIAFFVVMYLNKSMLEKFSFLCMKLLFKSNYFFPKEILEEFCTPGTPYMFVKNGESWPKNILFPMIDPQEKHISLLLLITNMWAVTTRLGNGQFMIQIQNMLERPNQPT